MAIFKIEIAMGNDAMLNNSDIRYALKQVIGNLDCNFGGNIRDYNGNTVGKYGYRD